MHSASASPGAIAGRIDADDGGLSLKGAAGQFSWLAPFVATDNPLSSQRTRELPGWQPKRPALIPDLDRPWHRLLRRAASESGRLHHGEETHGSGARRRRVLELPTLWSSAGTTSSAMNPIDVNTTSIIAISQMAAMSYLASKGIPADRITVVSYDKERPVYTEHNESGWARNRRDDFLTKPT